MLLSDPDASVDLIPGTKVMRIRGETGEALDRKIMTAFIFGDQFRRRLIAAVKIEVHAR